MTSIILCHNYLEFCHFVIVRCHFVIVREAKSRTRAFRAFRASFSSLRSSSSRTHTCALARKSSMHRKEWTQKENQRKGKK